MEDGQPRSYLLGKAEQVELGPELAVVTPLRLLQLVEVRSQCFLRFPRRPVNTLELLSFLVTAPVGAGDPHQLEVSQAAGRRDVGTPAQVSERVRVPIRADHRSTGIDFIRTRTHRLDDLALEGLIGEQRQSILQRMLVPDEGLVLGHDGAHLVLDTGQVVIAEVCPTGQFEVVVEPIFDDRADGVLGSRP